MSKQSCFRNSFWSDAPEISDFDHLRKTVFVNRNLEDDDQIDSFLNPKLSDLHDDFLFLEMEKAVARISSAIENKERIIVYGDFDTDGITATTILTMGLRELGAEVSYRIPDRNRDSHGLKKSYIDEFATKNVGLIITCDCGTNDCDEIAHANSLGIDTIITDHHEADLARIAKQAVACINPKVLGETYPERELSGSAIAFKLISACATSLLPPEETKEFLTKFLEIAAIGIVADCVPLQGENRILAKFGLQNLAKTKWPGLKKMLQKADVDPRNITAETVGFAIGPRLNAASRIGDVYVASELFCGDERKHFDRIEHLEDLNFQRQKLTEDAVNQAASQVNKDASFQLFFHENWIPGVLGLLASRYVSTLDQPVICATIREDGLLTASCRSSEGHSMIDALNDNADLFHKFGGHDGAAGFITSCEKLEEIRKHLNSFFFKNSKEKQPLQLEGFLSADFLNIETVDFLKTLEPFGKGNENPTFGIRNAQVLDFILMGKNKNHGRIVLDFEGEEFQLVAFFCNGLSKQLKIGEKYDFLFTISANFWQGQERMQLRFVDMRKT